MEFLPTLIVIASPFVGSFIGCMADRLPTDRPLLWSRSNCDHCDHVLGPRDRVPVLSWLLSGAKCRYCGGKLSLYYPLVEMAALTIALSALLVFDGSLLWITVGLGWGLLALAAMDLRHMILADSLNVVLAVSGLLVALSWSRYPMQDHRVGMLVGAGGLYLIYVVYRAVRKRDGLGLGDVEFDGRCGRLARVARSSKRSALRLRCSAARCLQRSTGAQPDARHGDSIWCVPVPGHLDDLDDRPDRIGIASGSLATSCPAR